MRLVRVDEFSKLMSSATILNSTRGKLGNKIAALDFGTKKIGLAYSDDSRNFVFPGISLERSMPRNSNESIRDVLLRLQKEYSSLGVVGVIIGFPILTDSAGEVSPKLTPLCNEILSIFERVPKLCNVYFCLFEIGCVVQKFKHSLTFFFSIPYHEQTLDVPCALWDESFSTSEARCQIKSRC